MFGEDNFGALEDYSKYYHKIGGMLSKADINSVISSVYSYLDNLYPDERYRHHFPSIETAISNIIALNLSKDEISKVVDTFAHHEIGYIPPEYIEVLFKLSEKYKLAVVIDIWAPKPTWLRLFQEVGISSLFSASSFSSDHGMVKPSSKPFELVIEQLGIKKKQGLMIGDSVRRDLGGAQAAGIDCVLVGGAKHPNAMGCYENLIEFSSVLSSDSRQ